MLRCGCDEVIRLFDMIASVVFRMCGVLCWCECVYIFVGVHRKALLVYGCVCVCADFPAASFHDFPHNEHGGFM